MGGTRDVGPVPGELAPAVVVTLGGVHGDGQCAKALLGSIVVGKEEGVAVALGIVVAVEAK